MMERRIQSILLLAGVAVFTAALAVGPTDVRANDADFAFDNDARLDRVAEVLDLDDTTRDQIAEISGALADENAPRRAEIRRNRLLLGSLLEETPPDEAAVMAQVDVLSALQSDLWKARLRAMMQVRSLLTPVQRERLVALRRGEKRQSNAACRDDVRTLCPNVRDLQSSVRCLIKNRDEISPACRESLSKGRLSRFFPADETP